MRLNMGTEYHENEGDEVTGTPMQDGAWDKRLRVAGAIVKENIEKQPNGSTMFANTFLDDLLARIAELEAEVAEERRLYLCLLNAKCGGECPEPRLRKQAKAALRDERKNIAEITVGAIESVRRAEAALAERDRMLRIAWREDYNTPVGSHDDWIADLRARAEEESPT